MATKNIKVENFQKEMTDLLTQYGDDVLRVADEVLEEVGEKGEKMVKSLSPSGARRAGKYKNTWTHTVKSGRLYKRVYIHQKAGKKFNNWRLVHLLEKGHMARDGSFVNPVKAHVEPTQKWVDEEVMRQLKMRLSKK